MLLRTLVTYFQGLEMSECFLFVSQRVQRPHQEDDGQQAPCGDRTGGKNEVHVCVIMKKSNKTMVADLLTLVERLQLLQLVARLQLRLQHRRLLH